VTVHLGGDPTPALEILHNLADVLRVQINEHNHIIVESSGDTDIRPKVVAALTASNLEILEIYSETASLEDIFLQLVNEEKAEKPAELTVESQDEGNTQHPEAGGKENA